MIILHCTIRLVIFCNFSKLALINGDIRFKHLVELSRVENSVQSLFSIHHYSWNSLMLSTLWKIPMMMESVVNIIIGLSY